MNKIWNFIRYLLADKDTKRRIKTQRDIEKALDYLTGKRKNLPIKRLEKIGIRMVEN